MTSVAVSTDGSLVASGSFDGGVRIYDAHTGASAGDRLRAQPGGGAVAFSADGTMIASGGIEMDKTLKLWNVRTGALFGRSKGTRRRGRCMPRYMPSPSRRGQAHRLGRARRACPDLGR